MKVAAFIANRIAFQRSAGKERSFSRFIIRLSTVATVISVMVMIVTLAFANGFQEKVSQKVFSFLGHIRIQDKQPDKAIISEESPIKKNDSLVNIIRQLPEIDGIYPYATKYGILKTKDEIEGVLVKGFDSTYDFNRLKEFIKEGRPIQFSDSSTAGREIMISRHTASQLNLKVNDRVLIYFIRSGAQQDNAALPNMRTRRLTVVGIFQTGIEDYDRTFAIGDLSMVQRLNADSVNTDEYKENIGGYEIFLKDYKKIDTIATELYEMPEFPFLWRTASARQISPNIFDWLNMQDNTRNVLIVIMAIVAVINLITCLIILVLERLRMIGVLKALGASNWTVQKIFLRHSAWITLVGILIGAGLGLGILFLQEATGFIRLKEEAYYLSSAAVKIVWWQVGLICAGTFVFCFAVMMIPSILVRKVQPVKAIHFR